MSRIAMSPVDANSLKARTRKIGLAAITLLLLSLFLQNFSISSALSEFTERQVNSIFAHVFFIALLQAIFFLLLGTTLSKLKFLNPGKLLILSIIFSVALTVNFHSLFLFHLDDLSAKPVLVRIGTAGIFLFIGYVLGNAILSSQRVGIGVALISLILLVLSNTFLKNDTIITNPGVGTELGKPAEGARNIYFISFDSMIPRSLALKFLETSDVPYMDVLEQNQARIFKNGFSNFVPTKPAMNSMLMLDPALFLKLRARERYLFYPGQAESTIYRVLRQRGYKFQTMYDSPYFGTESGPYTDYYMISRNQTNACKHVANDKVFLGFCLKPVLAISMRFLELIGIQADKNKRSFPGFLFDRIKLTARDQTPWFTMAHIYFPGHTAKDYRYDNEQDVLEYRDFFKKQSKIAARHLSTLINTVKAYDPNAIIMTYGDHGVWSSRGLPVQIETDFPADQAQQKFFVEDRHGINIAVWPGDICANEFSKIEKQNYAISTQVARAVIACGTLGPDPLQNEPVFRLPLTKIGVEDRPKFKEYIYE